MKKFYLMLFLAVGGVLLGAFSASAGSVNEKIEDLDQRQRVLERKWEVEEEKAKDKAVVTAGKEGFSFKTGDGKFVLKLKGLLQADGRFFAGLPQNLGLGTNTFLVRSLRPTLEGTVFNRFEFRLTPDFGNGAATLQDAYLDIRFLPQLKLRGGKQKEPVGLERLQAENNQLFVERGLPTNLVPNRDIGFQLFGDIGDGIFSYAVGGFNGVSDGASADIDTNDGKDVAVRLFAQPFLKTDIPFLKGLGIGIAGTYGKQKGTAAAPNLPSYKTAGQVTFFRYITDSATPANTVFAQGRSERFSPQLYYYWGPFGFLGEYVLSKQNVSTAAVGADLTHHAWQTAASFVLTGEDASYKGVKPKKPLNFKKGAWGALEVAARYNELRVDDDAFPTFAGTAASARQARAFGGGFNWYLNDNVKLVADFEHTGFEGGVAGGNRHAENVVQTRLQLAF